MSEEYDDKQPRDSGIDSPNNTHFNASDASPDKQSKYERLWMYNEDLLKGRKRVNQEEVWRRDRLATLDAIASDIGLSEPQHHRATEILDSVSLNELGGQQRSLRNYCFAICAFVYNADVKPNRDGSTVYIPVKSDDENPSHLVRVRRQLTLESDEVMDAMDDLRSAGVNNLG